MKAAIVTIGDEILIGQVIDTNSGYIAKSLDKIGVQICEMISVGDDRLQILEVLERLKDEVSIVFITGGLGPTKDDLTKKTLCDFFEDELVVNPEVLAHVVRLIEKVMMRPASQINRDQALVPSKATVLFNEYGTAPGMWMQKDNTVFVSLPGVPYEMKALLDRAVLPKIVKEFKRPVILHQTVITYGQGESLVAERIEEWEDALPSHIKLAYLPSPGKVRLRITVRGEDINFLEQSLQYEIEKLYTIIGDIIVGIDEGEPIEVVLGNLMTERGYTLSLAESCTGGGISQLITSVAGSSRYYIGGVVTYATVTKTELLGVDPSVIEKYSVVSREVAEQMAYKVREKMQSFFAVATTGNAGPSKGDADAEPGTVCIAIATPDGVLSEKFNFGQPRERVIGRTVHKALEMLYKEILKNY